MLFSNFFIFDLRWVFLIFVKIDGFFQLFQQNSSELTLLFTLLQYRCYNYQSDILGEYEGRGV